MNIADYIRNHEELSQLDFGTVYYTIRTLIDEGYLALCVDSVQPQSQR